MTPLEFLVELGTRIITKKPTFFKYLQQVSLFASLVLGLPLVFNYYDIILPDFWQKISDKTMTICALVVAAVSQLTTINTKIIAKDQVKNDQGIELKNQINKEQAKLPSVG